MSKPFLFFKDDAFTIIMGKNLDINARSRAIAEEANRLLNKEGSVVSNKTRKGFIDDWYPFFKRGKDDTQEALLLPPRPIEPEKPECDLDHNVVKTFLKLEALKFAGEQFAIKPNFTNCPKCQKDLT